MPSVEDPLHHQLVVKPLPRRVRFLIKPPRRDDFRRTSYAAIQGSFQRAKRLDRPGVCDRSNVEARLASGLCHKASRSALIWQDSFNRNNPEIVESIKFAHYAQTSNTGPLN